MMEWKKETPVFLYGAAYCGTLIYSYLKDIVTVMAFLDKRGDEILIHEGLPTYLPDSKLLNKEEKENAIVIICVKNIFDHKTIARQLLKNDFKYIVTFENSIFNDILEKKLFLPKYIETYQDNKKIVWQDNGYIMNREERIIVHIPAALVFTNKTKDSRNDKWSNWPIQALYTHLELFSLYNGDPDGNEFEYIEKYCIDGIKKFGSVKVSERWKRNILESRQKIFHNMNIEWQLKSAFFYTHAPTADFNNGIFNLTSGKHRATFLVSKGEKYIPLNITMEDYEEFLNMKVAKEIMEYVGSIDVEEFFCPIMHPYFYRLPSKTGNLLDSILAKIMKNVGKYILARGGSISKMQVFSYTKRYKALARYFKQIGCIVEDVVKDDQMDSLLEKLIPKERRALESNKYDLVILEAELGGEKFIIDNNTMYIVFTYDETLKERYLNDEVLHTKILHRFFFADNQWWILLITKEEK